MPGHYRYAGVTSILGAMSGIDTASPWAPPEQRRSARDALRSDKRSAVLRTAAQLFNEKGFHATSLDEVAARLNVTKPTLYRYVRSKDDILFECVRHGLQTMQQAVSDCVAAGGSALDQLQAGMRAYAHVVMQDFGRCVIRIGEDPLPAAGRAELRHLKRGVDHEFRRLLQACVDEGSIRPVDPKLAAFTLAGALSWVGRWYRPGDALAPEAIAAACSELLLNGLLPPPAPAAARTRSKNRPTPRGDAP